MARAADSRLAVVQLPMIWKQLLICSSYVLTEPLTYLSLCVRLDACVTQVPLLLLLLLRPCCCCCCCPAGLLAASTLQPLLQHILCMPFSREGWSPAT
jgi:hypothetical protein